MFQSGYVIYWSSSNGRLKLEWREAFKYSYSIPTICLQRSPRAGFTEELIHKLACVHAPRQRDDCRPATAAAAKQPRLTGLLQLGHPDQHVVPAGRRDDASRRRSADLHLVDAVDAGAVPRRSVVGRWIRQRRIALVLRVVDLRAVGKVYGRTSRGPGKTREQTLRNLIFRQKT